MPPAIANPVGAYVGELHERNWDTPTVIRIAGCEQATLLQWRRKYGFLGGAEPGRGRVGYKHSLLDICVVCAAVELVEHGIDPADACSDDAILKAQIELLISGDVHSQILGFHRGSDRPDIRVAFYYLGSDQTLGEIIEKTPGGVITLLDLRSIINRVLKKLGLTVVRGGEGSTILEGDLRER